MFEVVMCTTNRATEAVQSRLFTNSAPDGEPTLFDETVKISEEMEGLTQVMLKTF